MKYGLIPNEIRRLNRVNVFTPNVIAQWQEEENERSFLEWCREDQEPPRISIAGLPSRLYEREKVRSWLGEFLIGLIP